MAFEMPIRDGRHPVKYYFCWIDTEKWKNEEHQLHQYMVGGCVGCLNSQRES